MIPSAAFKAGPDRGQDDLDINNKGFKRSEESIREYSKRKEKEYSLWH